jgi:chromate transporter
MTTGPSRSPLGELAGLFFKLGLIAFGGPAAHIAMLEDEVVVRRRWMEREHFLDLVGATNLIPGPNSTEMTMHVGYARAGWPGLAVAGCCFILPAAVLTGFLGWLYVRFGTLPEVEPFLAGIKPAVLAIILGALWRLGRTALKHWTLLPVGAAVALALVLGVSEVVALLAGGVGGMLWLRAYDRARARPAPPGRFLPLLAAPSFSLEQGLAWISAAAGAAAGVSLWKLGLFFLKIGAILYGSGYVLIAFLQGGLVEEYGWLTQQQLLDAIAIGQFTPGPVLTTATFIGYVLGGVPGAVVATVGIFLPSFVFVGLLNPWVPRLRRSAWTAAFLDAVNLSAVALMAVVTAQLGLATLTGWIPAVIFLAAAVAVLRYRVSPVYLVLGGALLAWLPTLF